VMQPGDLREQAERVWGKSWRAHLARLVGVDQSTIRRWLAQQTPVPRWVEVVLSLLLERAQSRAEREQEPAGCRDP
jgi:hypothetical protein